MFERIREYMKIVEETNKDGDLYLYPLADLITQWHNIMVEFQDKLNQRYLIYLSKHPLPDHTFKRRDVQVIDMKDPNNVDLLTNYDEFHKRYTKQGTRNFGQCQHDRP